MIKRLLYCLGLGLTLLAGSVTAVVAAGKSTDDALLRRPDLVYGRLDNGLTYYIVHNEQPRGEAVYRLFVKSGSLNEEDDQQGLAHFLEHMAFNGSRHFPGDGMVRFLESKGARFGKDLNAHTTFDETVYKLQLPSTQPAVVDSTLLILADWATGLTLDAGEVDKERGVILSEWLTKQNGTVSTNQALLDELFAGSRYAERPTIGDTAIIAHAEPATLRRYYERWYRPERMAVAVVGDVDTAQVLTTIKRLFGQQTTTEEGVTDRTYPIAPYRKAEARLATAPHEKEIQLEVMRRIEPVGPIMKGEAMHGYVLRLVTSRLIKQRLARYSFEESAYNDAQMGRGSFVAGGDVWLSSVKLPREGVAEGIRAFLRREKQMRTYGFTEREIQSVRQQLLQQKRRSLKYPTPQTSTQLMQEFYNDFMREACCISEADELGWMERELPGIDSLEVLTYLRQMSRPRQTHYLLHGNPALAQQVPDGKALLRLVRKAQKAPVDRYDDGTLEADTTLSRPASALGGHITHTDTLTAIGAIRWRLDNGSDVTYRRNDDDHDRLMLTGFREGGLYHLDSLDYLAGLYAGAIIPISGAGTFSRDGLADFLKGSSASMSMLVDKNRTGISGAARTEDVDVLFQLLYTKWTSPRLDTAAYRRVMDQITKDIRTRTTTPDDLYKRQTARLLQDEDYVTRQQTLELLDERVSPERMLPLYDRLFGSAEGFHFILAGDLPTDSVRRLCDVWLGALPPGTKTFTQRYEPRYALRHDTTVVCPTEDEKAVVSLYWQDSLQTASLQLTQLRADLVKGVVAARLRQLLREDLGLTYSVSVSASTTLHPSPLWRTAVAFACQPQHTDTLVSLACREMARLAADPEGLRPTLDDVRRNLVKQHRLDTQRNTWWTGHIRNLLYNRETDWSFAQHYEQTVEAIGPEEVAQLIGQMLQAPRLTVIKRQTDQATAPHTEP